MLIKMSDWFHKTSKKGWLVLLFVVLDVAFVAGVMPYMGAIMALAANNGTGPLDLNLFYTPEQAFAAINAYGETGRSVYRIIELTADIIYPVIYTLAFGLLISWLAARGFAADSRLQRLNLLPVGAWLFDLLENIGIVTLLSIYPSMPTALAAITAVFTSAKWLFAFGSILTILVSLGAWVIKAVRK